MTKDNWQNKTLAVASLHLDARNPRLGRETSSQAPREIIRYLFEHDKALEVAKSITLRGYFPNEPLLVIQEDNRYIVVEGNRRLAALKALREPGLLEGSIAHQVERISRQIANPESILKVPVTIAPNRRATDKQIAGRHIGTPVLAWRAENRASFILEKLAEGYSNDMLRDELGFTLQDIQSARQTRAIADMARSLSLPDEVKAKIDTPKPRLFSTLERVFDSSEGRDYLRVKTDSEHGLVGLTTKKEFIRGLTKLVTDIALGHQSSRTLNTNEDIEKYFQSWDRKDLPAKKQGSFVPADVIDGKSIASSSRKPATKQPVKPTRQLCKTVLPRDLRVRIDNDRLVDIRSELIKLKREEFPNAGAVLLRVFFELSITDYLKRTGRLKKIIQELEAKGRKPPYDLPPMKDRVKAIRQVIKGKLTDIEVNRVEKALAYDSRDPFTIFELHGFVHSSADFPGERELLQFWKRTEPLLRLILEQDTAEST